jgi:tetratricopeptide (TPR) repeat protein
MHTPSHADPAELLQQAWQLASSDRPAEALDLTLKVLDLAPENLAALDVAARSSWSLGDPEAAEGYWRTAIRVKPECAEAYNNLAALLTATGRREEAKSCYRRALEIRPEYAEACVNLARLCLEAGELPEAVACYRRAAKLRPEEETVHYCLGILHKELGAPDEAEVAYRRALSLRPAWPDALNSLGVLLRQQERLTEAEECFRQALTLRSDMVEAVSNLGMVLATLDRPEEALVQFRDAASLRPDLPEVNFNLGKALAELKRFDEAEGCYRNALALRPDLAECHYNLGNLMAELLRFEEARTCFLRALEIHPGYLEALNNLGNLLTYFQHHSEAEPYYHRALAIDAEFADARYNLGLLFLAMGRYTEGWELYEARYDPRGKQFAHNLPKLPFPKWEGEEPAGTSIMVWAEQGFGDEIQFVRYLPLLKARGVSKLTLVCKDELQRLFQDADLGADQVLTLRETAALPPHDYWVFLLSLPRLLGSATPAGIPAALPYLAATPERTSRWSERLPAGGIRVGLTWKGSVLHRNDAHRSLPGLACLAPLWSVPGVTFIALQKDAGELLAEPPGQPLLDLGSELEDFADSAAVVAQLDLVICVDTSMCHLAGALGTPCWVMLPYYATDWRWMVGREDSPWYPEVLRLFQQQKPGDWDGVVAAVTRALAELLPPASAAE